jgi:hypothetical protein
MSAKPLLAKDIKKKILEHFLEYLRMFTPFQSEFLTGLYQRYHCLDNGSLILHFAKKTHQAILRKTDYDLNYDLSFEKFWYNHSAANTEPSTIMRIALESSLPKETARRKLSELTKQKILSKKNKYISWLPTEEYKNNYNKVVSQEIKNVAKLTKFVSDKMNLNFTNEEILKEYEKRFSFYWFHYLDLQLKWMKMWKLRFKDLEIPLIFLQFSSLLTSKVVTDSKLSHSHLYTKPNTVLTAPHLGNVSVSATSIADITGIPRATVIRKLNQMVRQKFLTQDKNSKRYYIIPEALNKNLVSKELTEKATEIFSDFYYISIKALSSKINT